MYYVCNICSDRLGVVRVGNGRRQQRPSCTIMQLYDNAVAMRAGGMGVCALRALHPGYFIRVSIKAGDDLTNHNAVAESAFSS